MENAPQVALAKDDDVVQALAAQRSDHPLRDGVRVGRPHRREHRLDSDTGRPRNEVRAKAAVAVSNQEARPAPPRRRLEQLPPQPRGRGMPRHVDVHDAPPVVGDEDHDVERAHGDRLHREQVDRPDLWRVVAQERPPRLRRWSPSRLIAVAAHGASAHREAQGTEFPDDVNGSPAWILARQAKDQLA